MAYSRECEDFCIFNKPAYINLIKKKTDKYNKYFTFQKKLYDRCTLYDWYTSITNPLYIKNIDRPLYDYLKLNPNIFENCKQNFLQDNKIILNDKLLSKRQQIINKPLQLREISSITLLEPKANFRTITKTNSVTKTVFKKNLVPLELPTIYDRDVEYKTDLTSTIFSTTTVIKREIQTKTITKNRIETSTIFKNNVETKTLVKNNIKTTTLVKNIIRTKTHNIFIYDDSPPPTVTIFKTRDLQVSEVKTTDVKVSEVKTTDVKVDEVKTTDMKADEVKTTDVKADEVKTNEAKTSEIKTNEKNPSEIKTSEVKTNETKSSEVKTSEIIFNIKTENLSINNNPPFVSPQDIYIVDILPPQYNASLDKYTDTFSLSMNDDLQSTILVDVNSKQNGTIEASISRSTVLLSSYQPSTATKIILTQPETLSQTVKIEEYEKQSNNLPHDDMKNNIVYVPDKILTIDLPDLNYAKENSLKSTIISLEGQLSGPVQKNNIEDIQNVNKSSLSNLLTIDTPFDDTNQTSTSSKLISQNTSTVNIFKTTSLTSNNKFTVQNNDSVLNVDNHNTKVVTKTISSTVTIKIPRKTKLNNGFKRHTTTTTVVNVSTIYKPKKRSNGFFKNLINKMTGKNKNNLENNTNLNLLNSKSNNNIMSLKDIQTNINKKYATDIKSITYSNINNIVTVTKNISDNLPVSVHIKDHKNSVKVNSINNSKYNTSTKVINTFLNNKKDINNRNNNYLQNSNKDLLSTNSFRNSSTVTSSDVPDKLLSTTKIKTVPSQNCTLILDIEIDTPSKAVKRNKTVTEFKTQVVTDTITSTTIIYSIDTITSTLTLQYQDTISPLPQYRTFVTSIVYINS
ncbi:blood-stage membrane protein ag-1 [Vairimorpha ceranae]|uniref:Blood-stage membrane protein ag-1 n=1 Tax=Vairimorpha ceranae TaxID=40302 RepID=A0A0F9WDQ6_9MICR|nr:blood-stage membrane protein ag-1 [Vairimorpha ceranae]KKO74925.1 blood-stage membrane protein ag-1 [Vairimorpha ceranae]